MTRYGVFLAFALTAACGAIHDPNLPWRTVDPADGRSAASRAVCSAQASPIPLTFSQLGDPAVQKRAQCVSHEQFGADATSSGFDLHTVEFDDQGRPWNQAQIESTVASIEAVRKTHDVLVVFFIHGWFNNARVCNGKLSCFREVLALLAQGEQHFSTIVAERAARLITTPAQAETASRQMDAFGLGRWPPKPRKVIGVYAGWRGGTLKIPGLKHLLTFWGRKTTAHTIGENVAAAELMTRLSRIVHPERNGGHVLDDNSSILFIGHSFGGAFLFSAAGNILSKAAGEVLAGPRDAQGRAQPVRGLGDLVLLVNPALEASPYQEFRRFASTEKFSDEQLPIMLTLSSENDRPNQVLFPLGQTIAAHQKQARSRQQWLSMIESIGTFQDYQTHRLIATAAPPPTGARVTPECGCDARIRDFKDVLLARLTPRYEALADQLLQTALKGPRARLEDIPLRPHAVRQDFLFSRLEPLIDIAPNSPFLTIQVDRKVIGGHSDIFNQRIVDFVMEYFVSHETKRHAIRQRRIIQAAGAEEQR